MALRFFRRYKTSILYGAGLALLLFILHWLEWRFVVFDHAMDLYTVGVAIVFTGLGIWLALKLAKPKVITIAVPAQKSPDPVAIEKLGISARELEVLKLMAEGLSNQEIADKLYVSLNTIKTHSSRIFEKLDARRRTQAVETARRLQIIW